MQYKYRIHETEWKRYSDKNEKFIKKKFAKLLKGVQKNVFGFQDIDHAEN